MTVGLLTHHRDIPYIYDYKVINYENRRFFSKSNQMRQVVKPILNRKGINKELFVNAARAKNIIGCPQIPIPI